MPKQTAQKIKIQTEKCNLQESCDKHARCATLTPKCCLYMPIAGPERGLERCEELATMRQHMFVNVAILSINGGHLLFDKYAAQVRPVCERSNKPSVRLYFFIGVHRSDDCSLIDYNCLMSGNLLKFFSYFG